MMILKYYGHVTCVFGYWKWVGRLEAVVCLDVQILGPIKTHYCLLLGFRRIQERDFKIRNFLACCLGNMIRWFIRFSKLCPSGYQGLFSNDFIMNGSVYQSGFITNNDHKFFHESRYSKTWKHFHFFAFHFFIKKKFYYANATHVDECMHS